MADLPSGWSVKPGSDQESLPSGWAVKGDVSRETMQPTAAGMVPPIPQPRGIPAAPGTTEDLGRMGAYLQDRAVRGLANFMSAPRALRDLTQMGVEKGLGALGVEPTGARKLPLAGPIPFEAIPSDPLATVQEQTGVNLLTGAQPGSATERRVGDFLEGAASFPPAALAGGVAGVTGQEARRRAAAAGASPGWQTAAELGGSLAGGLGTAAAQRLGQLATTRPPTPTIDALRSAKNAAYQRADNAGVVVKADSFRRAVADIGKAAKDKGLDPGVTPKANSAMRRLFQEIDEGRDLSLTEIDTLRKVIRRAAATTDPGDKAVALTMRNQLDSFLDDLKPSDLVSGNAKAVQTLKEARALNTRLSKGQQIDDMIESARERASQFSGSGFENALRTEFRQLARNDKRLRMFTPQEQTAIRAVNRGAPLTNFFRMVGKLAPTGVISGGIGAGGGAALGSALGGPGGAAVGAVALPVIGAGGRAAATGLTSSAANEVRNMMLRGYMRPYVPPASPPGLAAGLAPVVPQATLVPNEEIGLLGP